MNFKESSATAMVFLLSMSLLFAGQQQRRGKVCPDSAPKVGEMAPSFTLSSLDGKSKTSLDLLRVERPLVLFFSSYT